MAARRYMTVGEELQIEIIKMTIRMLLIVLWNIIFFPSIVLAAQLTGLAFRSAGQIYSYRFIISSVP